MGRSGGYDVLKNQTQAIAAYMKQNNLPFLLYDFEQDHIRPKQINDLVKFDRSISHCLITIKPLNYSRNYSKAGLL